MAGHEGIQAARQVAKQSGSQVVRQQAKWTGSQVGISGTTGPALDWIHSDLSDGTQCVAI